MPQPRMRNVSTPHQEKYQTADGNVTVTNFKRGLWQVMPRGRAPFMVGSKREAFDQALGISSRHWGMPKEQAFPRGTRSTRSHAAKKTGLSADQRADIDASLAAYGARLTDDDRIAKGDKVLSVQLEAKGGRLKIVSGGNVLASYPASRAGQGVSDFVEKFWFWKKDGTASGTGHARKKSPAQLDREIAATLAKRSHATRNPDDVEIGDAVQFLWEPQTSGIVRRSLPDKTEGRQWVEVTTARGPRKVPIDALRRVRKEHEARVRASVARK